MNRLFIAMLLGLIALPASAAVELHYIHHDHLGTPRVVTDQAQQVVWKGHLRPFGQMEVEIESLTLRQRFPGQRFDIETGLHYNYFRDYDPSLGRYIQSDPIGLQGGLNTYAYVKNNPLIYIDPTGEALLNIGAAFGAAALDLVVQYSLNGGRIECIKLSETAIAFAFGAVNPFTIVSSAQKVTRGGAAAVRTGQAGERAIEAATGISKNTERFVVNGRNRIPDFVVARDPLTGLPTRVIESKNVASQSLTRQLRDLRDLVGPGGRVDVALPPGARASGPLRRAFDDPNNPLFRTDIP